MGIMTGLFGEVIACAINGTCGSIRPKFKVYKSLVREGKLIRMRDRLKAELESIEDMCLPERKEFDLKWIALAAYLKLTHRTMRREELYAAREAKRHGNFGPAIEVAKRNAELKDILEEYFF